MNLPNKISLFRLALVPIFIVCYLSGYPEGYYHILGGTIFGIAAISDAIDGWIARRYHMITPLGRLLDPMADKLLALSALLSALAPCFAMDTLARTRRQRACAAAHTSPRASDSAAPFALLR